MRGVRRLPAAWPSFLVRGLVRGRRGGREVKMFLARCR